MVHPHCGVAGACRRAPMRGRPVDALCALAEPLAAGHRRAPVGTHDDAGATAFGKSSRPASRPGVDQAVATRPPSVRGLRLREDHDDGSRRHPRRTCGSQTLSALARETEDPRRKGQEQAWRRCRTRGGAGIGMTRRGPHSYFVNRLYTISPDAEDDRDDDAAPPMLAKPNSQARRSARCRRCSRGLRGPWWG